MLSKYYIYQNADTASSLIENQIALAENSKSDYWLSRIYNAKGVFLTYKGDRNEARKALQQAILHYKVIGDTTNLIHTSFNLAANNIDLYQLDEAIALLDTCAPMVEHLGKAIFRISHAFLSGTCYHLKDDYFKALAQYKICETIVEDTTFNRKNVNDPYTNIGSIYDQLNLLDLAESYYRKSIAYNEVYTTQKYGIITSNDALGNLLIKKEKRRKANNILRKVCKLRKKTPILLH